MRKELVPLFLIVVVGIAAVSGYVVLQQGANPANILTSQSRTLQESSLESSIFRGSQTSTQISSVTLTTTRTPTVTSISTRSSQGRIPGLPDCGSSTNFFTVPPLNYSDFTGITPLGNLNPPMHVRPTNHLYFSLKFVSRTQNSWLTEKVDVVSPGNLTIFEIRSNDINPTHTDYQLFFSPCNSFYGYFDHVTGLSQSLQSQFVPPFDFCHGYSGSNRQSCVKIVHVPVQAGRYLGTAGGVQNGSTSLDFGALDFRVPPLAFAVPAHYRADQMQAVCAIDYYVPAVANKLRSLLGSFDGSIHRTTPPICGSINQDVPGTAQGNWYSQGTTFPVDNESQTIALVHDNVNASQGVFSIGSSMTSLGFRGGPYYFSPRNMGFVNLDFQYVNPGQVYCYETLYHNRYGHYGPITKSIILVQVLDATTLRIEYLPSAGSCGSGPWTFTANYTDFQR